MEHDFGKNIIPAAIENDRVFAYPFAGYWRDVGTLEAYWKANMDLLDNESGLSLSQWAVHTNVEEEGRLGDRPPTFISAKSVVKNSVISPGCIIEGQVENSILSPGVFVAKGARIMDSVIMQDSQIQAGAQIEESILDKLVKVGENTVLGTGSGDLPNKEKPHHLSNGMVVVGKGSEVPSNFKIGKNSILHPKLVPNDYRGNDIPPGETIRPS